MEKICVQNMQEHKKILKSNLFYTVYYIMYIFIFSVCWNKYYLIMKKYIYQRFQKEIIFKMYEVEWSIKETYVIDYFF